MKLFSRQCGSVSRQCFSAKQKINIYWQGSGGIFFSVQSHLYPRCCKDKGHIRLVFLHLGSKGSSNYPVFDHLPLGNLL